MPRYASLSQAPQAAVFAFAADKGRHCRSKGCGTHRDGGKCVLSLLTRHCSGGVG